MFGFLFFFWLGAILYDFLLGIEIGDTEVPLKLHSSTSGAFFFSFSAAKQQWTLLNVNIFNNKQIRISLASGTTERSQSNLPLPVLK